jgi:predicted acetyltransferase
MEFKETIKKTLENKLPKNPKFSALTEQSIEVKKPLCKIVEPSLQYKESYLSALKEYHKTGIYLDQNEEEIRNNFPDFIERLKHKSLDTNMQEGHIVEKLYWIIDDQEEYSGKVSLAYKFDKSFPETNGSVGYNIVPSKREKGYGEKALELVLLEAHFLGIKKIFLVCSSTNIASRKIIEKNAGILQKAEAGDKERGILRYYINLQY